MQFLLIAHDGCDEDAPRRRQRFRADHMVVGDEMIKKGSSRFGAVLLDESQEIIGSMRVVEFPSRKELDQWLEEEPFVRGKVWQKIEIRLCRVGTSFEHLRPG